MRCFYQQIESLGAANQGPALATTGPSWKQFCGDTLSGVCRNFLRRSLMIEIIDVKEVVLFVLNSP